MVFRTMLRGAGLVGLLVACISANAVPLALDLSGKIMTVTDQQHGIYHFSEADLKALPVHTIETSTNWTRRARWQGPTLADVLARVGARGKSIKVYAYDDYSQEIPLSFIKRYSPILAYSEDGQQLDLSNFGPLFIVFPRDKFPNELSDVSSQRRFVFQVRRIEVK